VTVTSHQVHAANPPAHQELAAFEAVFFQYYTRVYTVVFRLVGDQAEAEDLTLETFWKLWQQPPTRAENLSGWLYRVATRLGYNALRAAKRRGRYEEAAWDVLQPATGADPAGEAERALERVRVRAILGHMPERDAQLLILRHSGLSYREIATALGVSSNSVGTLLARAESEFERLYSEGDEDAHRR
jgi:RNA polymerase sigma-70 factor (ECF subfamily)